MGRLRYWLRWFRRRKPGPERVEAEPPFDEPALVPRRPRPKPGPGSVALELPEDPDDVDARGREAGQ